MWPWACVLLALLFGAELLLPGRSLYRWDTLLYTLPVIQEAREQILAGHWPFWSAGVCSGTPLLANLNAGVLYPLRLSNWLLPLRMGLHLFVLAHLALSLFGMQLFLRRGLRLSFPAAVVGALAYATCGYARGMWDTYNLVALPWIPLGFTALLASGSPASSWRRACLPALGAGLCWWLMLLGGDFQAACLWPCAALLLCSLHPHRRRLLPALGLALGIGGLLAAPQWLPTLYAAGESYRAGGMPWAEAIERSVHPVRFLEWLVPHLFGPRGAWLGEGLAAPGADRALPWTASLHIGRLAFGLALLAWVRRARVGVRWGALLALSGGILSLGGFLPGFRYWMALPVFGGFRYPEKYLLWHCFGLAVLAAYGTSVLLTLWRANRRRAVTQRVLAWLVVLVAGTALATGVLVHMSSPAAAAGPWARSLWTPLALIVVLTLAGLYGARAGRRPVLAWVLLVVVLIDSAMGWFTERPTTARFDPLEMPLAAQPIRQSPASAGRVLHDPAATAAPAKLDLATLLLDERRVLLSSALLAYNSPVLWGLRTAGGFSPLESAVAHDFRAQAALPPHSAIPDPRLFLNYCRETAVTWLLTTDARSRELRALGLDAVPESTWGPGGALTLLHIRDAREAICETLPIASTSPTASEARLARLHRFRPGYFRVDLAPGAPSLLTVRETWAAGWSARDQRRTPLEVRATPYGMMRVTLAADTTQVRFRYVPSGWWGGLAMGLSGGLLALGLSLWAAHNPRRLWQRPAAAVMSAVLLAVGLGLAARAHWACTFDEGFHVARGMACKQTGDSRLSYFHPPFQNLLGATFADLAFGSRISLPTDGNSWRNADIWTFASDFAGANRADFPEIVRAARWGSTCLLALMIGVGVWWAFRWRGPLAGWLAGLGLALNPTLLAHGNLATTDMGVTAFVVLGTALFWRAMRQDATPGLWMASLAYAAAAATKHSGLVWLLAYLLVAIPWVAVTRQSARPLWQIPFGVLMVIVLLVSTYGWAMQEIRVPTDNLLAGISLPAGRYLEGLITQGQHSLEGHRAFFAGERLMRGSWWYMPTAIALKTPLLWLMASLLGAFALARRGSRHGFAVWIPCIVFVLLLVFANRLAIGVRHALPLLVFGTVLAAVWAAGISAVRWRGAVVTGLALASLAAVTSYPHFISYYPAWAGGVSEGHRWMVDSNYDWGQDLEALESKWAELTAANGGQAPHLIYFGFVDPVVIYNMPVTDPALCGFMGRLSYWQAGADKHAAWATALSEVSGVTVASISALELDPFGTDFSDLRAAPVAGKIGNAFRVCVPDPHAE